MPKFFDMRTMRFGRWTVLSRAADYRPGIPQWNCRCDCGNEGVVRASILKAGQSRSCGCLNVQVHRDMCVARNTSHGMSKTPTYGTWSGMISRCYDPSSSGYAKYGARGVTVCERWRDSFEAFLADMGTKPARHMTIDRIDGKKGYEPGNCRWATQQTQQRNRGNNRLITFNGETRTLIEWAQQTGIERSTIAHRLDRGWSPERALRK